MRAAVDDPAPRSFMAELVGLLDGPPAGPGGPRAETLAARLGRLERDAHRSGAPETTVEAIRSARALLRLAETPVVFVVRANAGAVH